MNPAFPSSCFHFLPRILLFGMIVFLSAGLLFTAGCAGKEKRTIEVTAYCGCGSCCGWQRGTSKCLRLDFWNKTISSGPQEGQPYSGKTASGTKPRQPRPGLFSVDSLLQPWMIPVRLVFFPWLLLPQDGTIAADTRHYPFGTRMYVPGYGYGVVEDRGSAIQGPGIIDIYFRSHGKALQWGRQQVEVTVYRD